VFWRVLDYRNNSSDNYNYKDPSREIECIWIVKNGSDVTVNTDNSNYLKIN
jgi:hypothetical protein